MRSVSLFTAAFLLIPSAEMPRVSLASPAPPATAAAITGQYPNLLGSRGRSAAEIDAWVAATFQQLFHGDLKTQALFYPPARIVTAHSRTSLTSPTMMRAPRA